MEFCAGTAPAPAPDKFHLRNVCFDAVDGDDIKIRLTLSRSHTYGSELPEEPTERVIMYGIGHDKSLAMYDDRYSITIDHLSPENFSADVGASDLTGIHNFELLSSA